MNTLPLNFAICLGMTLAGCASAPSGETGRDPASDAASDSPQAVEIVVMPNQYRQSFSVKVALAKYDEKQAADEAVKVVRPHCNGAEPKVVSFRDKEMATGTERLRANKRVWKRLAYSQFRYFEITCS